MYSVTIGIKSKDGLLAVVDWVLRTDGLTLAGLKLDPASKAATKGKVAPVASGAPAKAKATKLKPGESNERLLAVIKQTFADGTAFNPKQISALAIARGVPKGAVYGGLATLAKERKLHRPSKGFYGLVLDKEAKG